MSAYTGPLARRDLRTAVVTQRQRVMSPNARFMNASGPQGYDLYRPALRVDAIPPQGVGGGWVPDIYDPSDYAQDAIYKHMTENSRFLTSRIARDLLLLAQSGSPHALTSAASKNDLLRAAHPSGQERGIYLDVSTEFDMLGMEVLGALAVLGDSDYADMPGAQADARKALSSAKDAISTLGRGAVSAAALLTRAYPRLKALRMRVYTPDYFRLASDALSEVATEAAQAASRTAAKAAAVAAKGAAALADALAKGAKAASSGGKWLLIGGAAIVGLWAIGKAYGYRGKAATARAML